MVYLFAFILPTVALFVLVMQNPVQDTAQAAPEISSWLKSAEPSIRTIKNEVPFESLPPYSLRDCLPNTKFVTVPKNILSGRAEISYNGCAVQTAFGLQSAPTGDVRLSDTNVAGPVKNSGGSKLIIEPIPGSQHILYLSSALHGSHLFIVKNFASNSSVQIQPDGSIYHQLKPEVDSTVINDSTSAPLAFAAMRFSSNGRWLVGEVPFRGLTRVNIETGETLTFGSPFNHSIGLRPKFVSAISSDGRYVITAENTYEILKVYDLATCQPQTDPTKSANCQSKDLLSFMRARLSGFKFIYHARFVSDYSIRFYARYSTAGQTDRYGYFVLTAAGEKESLIDYLALGDSFSSGEGAHSYKAGTDVENPFNKCHLSLLSYPYLLAARTNLNSAESVVCSGAKLKDIYFSGEATNYNWHEKQSEGKEDGRFDEEIFTNFHVGYRPQSDFVEKNRPNIVTLGISGNDFGFGKILLACIMPGTCYESPQERLDLVHTINSKFDQIVATYSQVKDKAGSDARIYVHGYPSLTNSEGNCALNVHLNKQELVFVNNLASYINSVVERAATKAGVSYINVEDALAGHRLCEAASWNVAVNGLTAGDDKTFSLHLLNRSIEFYLTGRESYHPNQLGHRLYANTILSVTNGFSLASPDGHAGLSAPMNGDATGLIDEAMLGLSPRKIVFSESLSSPLLIRGETSSAIPPPTQTGLQILHSYTKNQAGEDIDIQQLVYVAASVTDFDGDGVSNQQEKCLLVTEANTDHDQDGIDDACDGYIAEKPSGNCHLPAVAEASLNGYNGFTLSSQKTQLRGVVASGIVSAAVAVCVTAPVSGQANLQPSGGAVQPTSNQNQTGGSNLNQTGSLQNNQAAPALNQTGNAALGVVSSPSQTQPDAVVAPSDTLKTDITQAEEGSSVAPWIAIGSFVIAAGLFWWWRAVGRHTTYNEASEEIAAEEEVWIEASDIPKKQKKPKKKRKKAHHR